MADLVRADLDPEVLDSYCADESHEQPDFSEYLAEFKAIEVHRTCVARTKFDWHLRALHRLHTPRWRLLA